MDCSRPSSKMWNACRSRPFTGLPLSLTTTSTTTRLEAVRIAGPLDCGAASLDCMDGALAGCGAGAGSCADMAMANTKHCASAIREKIKRESHAENTYHGGWREESIKRLRQSYVKFTCDRLLRKYRIIYWPNNSRGRLYLVSLTRRTCSAELLARTDTFYGQGLNRQSLPSLAESRCFRRSDAMPSESVAGCRVCSG